MQPGARMEALFRQVSVRIESARGVAARGAIVLRTNYGELVPERLAGRYGAGWSVRNLKYLRQFCMMYSNSANAFAEFAERHLTWSHYLVLVRIDNSQSGISPPLHPNTIEYA